MRTLLVMVKPNARKAGLAEQADGSWLAQLKSPPVDGKANAELVALIAGRFGCTKTSVRIKSGAGTRIKRIELPDQD